MSELKVSVPQICIDIVAELRNLPFYKTDNGYCYAAYLLENEDVVTKTHRLLATDEYDGLFKVMDWPADQESNMAAQVKELIQKAIDELSGLVISDEVLTTYITFHKRKEGILTYYQIFERLQESLILLTFEKATLGSSIDYQFSEDCESGLSWTCADQYQYCLDNQKLWEQATAQTHAYIEEKVLNRNNPFADITIKSQRFIYGSNMGQFDALGLTTSRTITAIPKTTETSYIVSQPGFKIKRLKSLDEQSTTDMLFDNTLTTELIQDDENIYVYIE